MNVSSFIELGTFTYSGTQSLGTSEVANEKPFTFPFIAAFKGSLVDNSNTLSARRCGSENCTVWSAERI